MVGVEKLLLIAYTNNTRLRLSAYSSVQVKRQLREVVGELSLADKRPSVFWGTAGIGL